MSLIFHNACVEHIDFYDHKSILFHFEWTNLFTVGLKEEKKIVNTITTTRTAATTSVGTKCKSHKFYENDEKIMTVIRIFNE